MVITLHELFRRRNSFGRNLVDLYSYIRTYRIMEIYRTTITRTIIVYTQASRGDVTNAMTIMFYSMFSSYAFIFFKLLFYFCVMMDIVFDLILVMRKTK